MKSLGQSIAEQMLLSHPHQSLSKHILEVKTATQFILAQHSSDSVLGQAWFQALSERLCSLHDLGKGNQAFQKYIRDPKAFKGDPREKAHTPLSFVLSILLLQNEKEEPLQSLAILQAVLCHHGHLLTRCDLSKRLNNDTFRDITSNQLQNLKQKELAKESGESITNILQHFGKIPFRKMKKFVEQCWAFLDEQTLEEAFCFRIWSQALFSVLLEADKAFLATSQHERYLFEQKPSILSEDIQRHIETCPTTPINQLREAARKAVQESVDKHSTNRLFALSLPTGLGKTLTAATWALEWKKHLHPNTKIIMVLPYLTIIEQTERIYRQVFCAEKQGEVLLSYHSLSERSYQETEETNKNQKEDGEFFIDTWRSEIIITTYDQFLLALMSPKARYQMRMHQLCDALIIFDELQTIPCRLWTPIEKVLEALTKVGNSRVLAMSATLPPLLRGSQPLLSDEEEQMFFSSFNRYYITLDHTRTQTLEEFTAQTCEVLGDWEQKQERVLIVVNTRESARFVHEQLCNIWHGKCFFLTSDVVPKDRLVTVSNIQNSSTCLVVATQCVEAGVDLDMDRVIRDFAPLDSIIQVAGRCNRHQHNPPCPVTLVQLAKKSGKTYSSLIYDPIHLQATKEILGVIEESERIDEKDIFALSQKYFSLLSERKNLGKEEAHDFAYWRENMNIREFLRGIQGEQFQFIVSERSPGLEEKLQKVLNIPDRWKRRTALRHLAHELAEVTVSVYAKQGFNPGEIAHSLGAFWILDPDHYTPERGIELPNIDPNSTFVF